MNISKKALCVLTVCISCNATYASDGSTTAQQTASESITRPLGVGYAFDYLKNSAPRQINSMIAHAQSVLGLGGGNASKCSHRTSRSKAQVATTTPTHQRSAEETNPPSDLKTRLTTTVSDDLDSGANQTASVPQYCVIEHITKV